jgi:hypothetical protein
MNRTINPGFHFFLFDFLWRDVSVDQIVTADAFNGAMERAHWMER